MDLNFKSGEVTNRVVCHMFQTEATQACIGKDGLAMHGKAGNQCTGGSKFRDPRIMIAD